MRRSLIARTRYSLVTVTQYLNILSRVHLYSYISDGTCFARSVSAPVPKREEVAKEAARAAGGGDEENPGSRGGSSLSQLRHPRQGWSF